MRRIELARRPERRTAIWSRLLGPDGSRLCVANLHATAEGDHTARRARAPATSPRCAWSLGADSPLVVGGDMNLRPREHPWAFAELRDRFGLAPPTADDAVDHLLARGARNRLPPRRLRADEREVVRADGARVRLSDHAPVEARYKVA